MSDFYYNVEYYSVRRHKQTGRVLSEDWIINGGDYDTIEEAITDNPACQFQQRIVKRYYEVVKQIEAQE